ncbi:MAG: hypothetical protein DI570_21860 [Phenylobacterium zucineum]|nr:MAG: hypothetical protein DI570_21860 [Phenylobacterium zucineum]
MRLSLLIGAMTLATALSGAAQAAVCRGEAPAGAETIRGPVLHVLDGDTLCVALGADPSTWVAVRVAGALGRASTATPQRETLMAASFGQDVTCRITGQGDGVALGECRTAAGSVADMAQDAAYVSAGRGWR